MDYDRYCENLLNNFFENHSNYFPKYVYKYYDFNGGYLSLKNQTIQFTNPIKFDDPSECRVERIKIKNQGKRIKESLLSASVKQYEFTQIGYNVDESNILKASYRDIEKSSTIHWENTIKTTGVTCFTLLDDSDFHWDNYANNHNGICVKYNLDMLIDNLHSSSHFEYKRVKSIVHSPVIYVDNIQAVKYGEIVEDKLLMLINWMFVKDRAYESEMEYRLYSQNCKIEGGYERVKISKVTILGVKVGKNVSNEDIQKIKDLGF